MFTRQSPLILNSLIQGGLSAASANAMQNLVGQCRAPLVHRGPVEIDYTRPEMRLITPETGKFQFPTLSLEPPQSFPRKLSMPGMPNSPPFPTPEEPPPLPPECPDCGEVPVDPPPEDPGHNPHFPEPQLPPPPTNPGCKKIEAGAYLDNAGPCGVYLKTGGRGKHCTFGSDSIDGVTFTGDKKDKFYIEVKEYTNETQFLVKSPKLQEVEFIHSISVGEERITFEIWKAKMFSAKLKETKYIELTQCEQ